MKRKGGNRRKSRYKLKKLISEKGKINIRKYMQTFKPEEKVLLKADSAHQDGMYCLRFHGKIGKIIKQQGDCYEVQIKDGSKLKNCIIHPSHLAKQSLEK